MIRWRTSFYEPLHSSGELAITSTRILAVYDRTSFTVFPPRVVVQTKRHQCAHGHLTMFRTTQSPRVIFLLVAASLSLVYPFGLALGVAALLTYVMMPRRELTLWSGGLRRSFPLRRSEHDIALKTLALVTSNGQKPAAVGRAVLNDAS